MSEPPKGPIIIWEDYGYEGWHPRSYPTVKDALLDRHDGDVVITRLIDFDVTEKEQP